jgi:hypothetical protein
MRRRWALEYVLLSEDKRLEMMEGRDIDKKTMQMSLDDSKSNSDAKEDCCE